MTVWYFQRNTDNMSAGKKKNDNVQTAKAARVAKEMRNIPNVILKIETFEKDLLKLGTRCKKNLLVKTKLSTCRDFRFRWDQMQVQEDDGQEDVEDEEDDEDNENDEVNMEFCSLFSLESF